MFKDRFLNYIVSMYYVEINIFTDNSCYTWGLRSAKTLKTGNDNNQHFGVKL